MGLVLLLFALAIGYLTIMACLKIRKKTRNYLNEYRGWKIRDYLDRYGEDFREERRKKFEYASKNFNKVNRE